MAAAAAGLLGARTPFWRTLLPWAAFQGYFAVGLLLPPEPGTGGFLLAAVLLGCLTAAAAALRRRPGYPRGRALLLGWAIPWGVARVLSVLRQPAA